ncbi:hypothetical protein EES45_36310 [Streptomyces sp. ADI97-07]|uniref:hypothetical protein n=1 Tax=Streptomyces sp. ADI97-07 TaxID=1522762 RepID=UPI000FB48815|nr:hypothetical protein [Streptomyces sp. ADI97-07]RPK69986.1 hypothetical protein EES45_36310 [Streptomyces sp. ADI97-07]
MEQPLTMAEARAARQAAHWEARQRRQVAARGDAGLADAWWDRARAVCKANPELWNDLARTLENWTGRNEMSDGA